MTSWFTYTKNISLLGRCSQKRYSFKSPPSHVAPPNHLNREEERSRQSSALLLIANNNDGLQSPLLTIEQSVTGPFNNTRQLICWSNKSSRTFKAVPWACKNCLESDTEHPKCRIGMELCRVVVKNPSQQGRAPWGRHINTPVLPGRPAEHTAMPTGLANLLPHIQ